MTQFECEMALIKLAEAAQEIVKMYNAEINYTSISINANGYISVDAARFDGTKLIKGGLMSATKFSDGDIMFGGEAEESA